MFTNGVVASVKICRDDDGTTPKPDRSVGLTAGCGGRSRDDRLTAGSGVSIDADRDLGVARDADDTVVTAGPAPQEGSKT